MEAHDKREHRADQDREQGEEEILARNHPVVRAEDAGPETPLYRGWRFHWSYSAAGMTIRTLRIWLCPRPHSCVQAISYVPGRSPCNSSGISIPGTMSCLVRSSHKKKSWTTSRECSRNNTSRPAGTRKLAV